MEIGSGWIKPYFLGIATCIGLYGLSALISNYSDVVDFLTPLPPFAEPEMVVIPAGEFMMGSDDGEENEQPVHKVKIAQPFELGKYEVTFDEWDICYNEGGCPSKLSSKGWGRRSRPAIHVSWRDAKQYVQWLSKKTGKDYRLPTEAEWEYAARAGNPGRWFFGNDVSKLGEYAWFIENSGRKTHPVGMKKPNPFGLYDIYGNVIEWVEDCYDYTEYAYQNAPSDGTAYKSGRCRYRIRRGGDWSTGPDVVRSARRKTGSTNFRKYYVGFRVARTLTP